MPGTSECVEFEEIDDDKETDLFNDTADCYSNYEDNEEKDAKKKSKTGRKVGYKMPGWSKILLASRRDSIALESVNRVLSRVGEELTKLQSQDKGLFLATSSSGKQKTLYLVNGNTRHLPNNRNFLFRDMDTGTNINFKTQEIYSGIMSGVFVPIHAEVRDAIYHILAESSELQTSTKEKILANRTEAELAINKHRAKNSWIEPGEDDCFTLPENMFVNNEILMEIYKVKSISKHKKKKED